MKRSRLTRYTPLPPPTKPMARSRIRQVSKDRAKLKRQVKPIRDEYMQAHPKCEICNSKPSRDPHEILRGNARQACLDKTEFLLAVCPKCHDKLGDFKLWPVERQLAWKAIISDKPTDCALVNEIRGRAATAITWRDIAFHLDLDDDF